MAQDASSYSLDAALNGYTLLEGRTLGDVPHGAPPHNAFNNFVDVKLPIDQVRTWLAISTEPAATAWPFPLSHRRRLGHSH